MPIALRIMLWSALAATVTTAAIALLGGGPHGPVRLVGMTLSTWLVFTVGAALVTRLVTEDNNDYDAVTDALAKLPLDGHLDQLGRVVGDGAAAPLAHQLNHTLSTLEGRIQRAEQRAIEHRAVLSAMRDGVLAINKSGQVMLLNPAAGKLFGRHGLSASGQPVQQLVRHPDLLKLVDRVATDGQPIEQELPLDRDGEHHTLQVIAGPISGGGVVLVMADVTRIRELEAMRANFAANVSHELKTPITAIKGAVDALLDGAAEDPEDRRRFLDMLARQSNRLERLVTDTLSLSRLEREARQDKRDAKAGLPTSHSDRPVVPVAPILSAAAGACEERLASTGVALTVTCPNGLSAPMDAPMIEQALVNLITNAIHHSPEGGQISLTAKANTTNDSRWLVITVADHGPGIDPSHHDRLFERFYRVDAGRATKHGGTGLGLAIVKHVAMSHGGKVSVDSQPGQGATFAIHLPLPQRA